MKSLNPTSLPTPTSDTPAAGAPVAPPSGADDTTTADDETGFAPSAQGP
jgi:hypothetical protein